LPASIRILVPGSTRFEVTRTDASSILLTTKGSDLFDCPAVRPLHVCHACKAMNDLLFGARTWKTGDQVARKGFMAEVREVSAKGAPRSIAFHFDRPLESEQFVWLFFDWRRFTHSPLVLPQIGETVEIAGPRLRSH